MTQLSFADLYETILDILEYRLSAAGFNRSSIDPETHLLESGILDSFGILDTLIEIEDRTKACADLGDMDFEKAMTMQGLVDEILRINSDE